MSKYHEILTNISSLNDSDHGERKTKTKKNVNIWERTLFELFLCIIKTERKVFYIFLRDNIFLKNFKI